MKNKTMIWITLLLLCMSLFAPVNQLASQADVERETQNNNKSVYNSEVVNPSASNVLSENLGDSNRQTMSPDEKKGNLVSAWLSGETFENIKMRKIGDKFSVMLLIKGSDTNLGGSILPISYLPIGNTGVTWVHALIENRKQALSILNNDNVYRMDMDVTKNTNPMQSLGDKVKKDSTNPTGTISNSARQIIGADYANDKGFTGSGITVNVMDDGVDFGHTALRHAMSLDETTNASESFDGGGHWLAITNLHPMNEEYSDPLFADDNGIIDVSFAEDLTFWASWLDETATLNDFELEFPNTYNVTGIAGNNTSDGYAFGFSSFQSGGNIYLMPILLSNSTGNGYDTLHIDYETGLLLSQSLYGYFDLYDADNDASFEGPTHFGMYPAHKNGINQQLSVDLYNSTGHKDPDGYYDISVGALGNTFDAFNVSGRLNISDPMIRGIDSTGEIMAFFGSGGQHGTGVAGDIAAKPVGYTLQNNETKYSVEGVAPDAKILGTFGLSAVDTLYGWLWAAGFDHNNSGTLQWTYTGEHVANISSNSFGFVQFSIAGNAYGFDYISLFIELLSPAGVINPDHDGMLFVVASGNYGPGYGTMSSPIGPSAMMVGATTSNWWYENYSDTSAFGSPQGYDEVAPFSTSGPENLAYPKVDIVNIGAWDFSVRVPSAVFDETGINGSTLFGGTSQATPLTSGALAIVMDADPSLSIDDAKSLLKSTATDLGYDTYHQGSGRVNLVDAIDYIQNFNSDLYLVTSSDSYDNAADIVWQAFQSMWGNDGLGSLEFETTLDYGPLSHPSDYINFNDAALYPGRIAQDDAKTIGMNLTSTTGSVTPNFAAYRYETTASSVNDSIPTNDDWSPAYNIHSLFSEVSSDITTADMAQISYSVTDTANRRPIVSIIMIHHDDNSDGQIDGTEQTIYSIGSQNSDTGTLFVSSQVLQSSNAYLVLQDQTYTEGEDDPMQFNFGIRTFERTTDSSVSVGPGTGNNDHDVTFDTTGMEAGFHQGFVEITSGSEKILVPYSFSVMLDTPQYETDGWSRVMSDGTGPYSNKIIGGNTDGGLGIEGDWRHFDISLSGDLSNVNTLAFMVNWTHVETDMFVLIFDRDGQLVGQSTFDSEGLTYKKILVNVSSYELNNTNPYYQQFSVAIQTTTTSIHSLPAESFDFHATWTSATRDQFESPEATINTNTGGFEKDGLPVSVRGVGVNWTKTNDNPIPEFRTPSNPNVSFSVGSLAEIHREITVPANDLSKEAVLFGYQFNLNKGMTAIATLDWSPDADWDMVLIKSTETRLSCQTDLFECDAATLDKPEVGGPVTIPETGKYQLLIIFWDGAPVSYDLEIDFTAVTDVASASGQGYELWEDIPDANDGSYGLTANIDVDSWGFQTQSYFQFYYDSGAPSIEGTKSIPDDETGDFTLATITDLLNFDVTVEHEGDVIKTYDDASGSLEVEVDSDLIEGLLKNETFTITATDELGEEITATLKVFRDDTSEPVITGEYSLEAQVGVELTITWNVEDLTHGTYIVSIAGVEHGSGDWQPGESAIVYNITFSEQGTKFVKFELTDIRGNTDDVSVRVKVGPAPPDTGSPDDDNGDGDSGFIPGFGAVTTMLTIVSVVTITTTKRRKKQY